MDEQELQEFSLDDIMKEFGSAQEDTPEPSEETAGEALPAEAAEQTPEEADEEMAEEAPAVTGDTIRMEAVSDVTGDTIRMEPVKFSKGQVHNAEPVAEEEPGPMPAEEAPAEPFSEGWEPEYEQPIAEYVPPRPILIHPRSKLKELKRKLVEGPEKSYYDLLEKGLGKLQIAIFISLLVSLVSVVATALYAFGMVGDNRIRLMVFGQFLAMLVAALLGSFQLIEGVADLVRRRFSLNTLLVFTFVLCCVDGVLCLKQLRVPCCAAFSLQVTMSLWSAYQKRNTAMGQLDTLRRANRLEGLTAQADYWEETPGLLRGEGRVEDFMDNYTAPSKPEKVLSVYALVALCISVAIGIAAGVLHGLSAGIQVAAVTALAAMPASMFITLSRPMAILERRLHALGSVLCGWQGVEGLSRKAVFPLEHEDICPAVSVKLNGVKFYGDRESDQVIAYAAALICTNGGALAPVFNHLLESRNGIHYEVAAYRTYENGGIGGEVNAEPVLVGTLPFLKDMGVEVPEGIRVNHAVGISVDGELCGLFAITYEKVKASAAGIGTLSSYRGLKPVIISDDFMLTPEFIHGKFGIQARKLIFPDYDQRSQLREKTYDPEAPIYAMSVKEGLAPLAYCVTGAKALKTASTLGVVLHMIGGILGMAIMLVLTILGALELLTPANMFLYQLVWLIPALLISNWTRPI